MPQTDHLAFCPPEVRREFDDLFRFARLQGVAAEGDSDHYATRFVVDRHAVRREIDLLVAGKVANTLGTGIAGFDVRAMAGYPAAPVPDDATAYPEQWVRSTGGRSDENVQQRVFFEN